LSLSGGNQLSVLRSFLRVYHQRYRANRFSVEPYQYGKDNPEGIASVHIGSIIVWIQSDDKKLAQIAEEEQKER